MRSPRSGAPQLSVRKPALTRGSVEKAWEVVIVQEPDERGEAERLRQRPGKGPTLRLDQVGLLASFEAAGGDAPERVVVQVDPAELDPFACVGICYLNGEDIAAALVRAGLARDCPRFSGGRYAAAERQAAAEDATIGHAYPLPGYCRAR